MNEKRTIPKTIIKEKDFFCVSESIIFSNWAKATIKRTRIISIMRMKTIFFSASFSSYFFICKLFLHTHFFENEKTIAWSHISQFIVFFFKIYSYSAGELFFNTRSIHCFIHFSCTCLSDPLHLQGDIILSATVLNDSKQMRHSLSYSIVSKLLATFGICFYLIAY